MAIRYYAYYRGGQTEMPIGQIGGERAQEIRKQIRAEWATVRAGGEHAVTDFLWRCMEIAGIGEEELLEAAGVEWPADLFGAEMGAAVAVRLEHQWALGITAREWLHMQADVQIDAERERQKAERLEEIAQVRRDRGLVGGQDG